VTTDTFVFTPEPVVSDIRLRRSERLLLFFFGEAAYIVPAAAAAEAGPGSAQTLAEPEAGGQERSSDAAPIEGGRGAGGIEAG
jgi:hypothetical protein